MILVDLNVILDVVQKREPHYGASAAVIDTVVQGRADAALPVHGITTIHYLVQRYQSREIANQAVDWLLRYFRIAPLGHREIMRARALDWNDFEDAVLAAAAESMGCSVIVTRNVKDFREGSIPAMLPEEYLLIG